MRERVGKYEIKGPLGSGGFGQVFRALDPAMGRMVAIKVLTAGNEPELLTRFNNEAAAAGRLRHKNIVTVYDFCEQDGEPYIVMELLEGEDLHSVIAKGTASLPLFEKTRIVSEMATGLHHAHVNGIVHRDVKPANVMLLKDGGVKIMDFGIALLSRATGSRLTPQGSVMGTFRYMAPEQFYAQPSDLLTDIFSVGVTAYEFISGEHPFHSSEPATLMRNIMLLEAPSLRSRIPECPEALDRVIAKLLSKDREQRYQSLDDARFDLEPVLQELGKARTAELLASAKERVAAANWDEAKKLIREILDLDPGHAEAREIRESLQRLRHQKEVRARLVELVESGKRELASRHYAVALGSFEAAVQLDSTNLDLRKLLEETRKRAERVKKAEQLVAAASAEFDRREFAQARETLAEALRQDPESQDAQTLLESVEKELAHLERERIVDGAMQAAGQFVASQAYGDALDVLAKLGADADSPRVQRFREWIEQKKTEWERKERLMVGVGVAEELLRANRFQDALDRLLPLTADFPNQPEVSRLQLQAEAGLARQQREREVGRITEQAEALAQAGDFDAALEALEAGIQAYPDDEALERLRANTESSKTAHHRRLAVESALADCDRLASECRFAEAIERAQGALEELRPEPLLEETIERLEESWTRDRRERALSGAEREAGTWLDQAYPEKAIPVLAGALEQFPGEARLLELLSRAREEQRRAVDQVSQEAARHCSALAFQEAQGVLEQGLARFPEEAILERQLEALKNATAAWRRRQTIHDIVAQAGAWAREGHYSEAWQLLAAYRREYRDDPALCEAQQRVELAWRESVSRETILKAAAGARQMIEQGQLDQAVDLLRQALASYPNQPVLVELLGTAFHAKQTRQKEADIARAQNDAEVLALLGDSAGAIHLLELMLEKWPGESALASQIDTLKAGREAGKIH